jgi:hypothetical protein
MNQDDAPEISFPEAVRKTCTELFHHEWSNSLPAYCNVEEAKRKALSLDVEEVKRIGSSLALNANSTRVLRPFESVEAEASLIVLLHALDFGGGWRKELHESNDGKGAFITVKAGVEAMFEACPSLLAAWLASLHVPDVASLFRIEGKPSLIPFATQLTRVCNEIGQSLQKRNFLSIAEFLKSFFSSPRNAPPLPSSEEPQYFASDLVRLLVKTFPFTFNDVYTIRGVKVCFYKKAQLIAGELFHRFRSVDSRFAFADAETILTAFIDNVIVACLRKDMIVVVRSDSLQHHLDTQTPLASGSEYEVSLRAAALVGIETMVQTLDQRVTSVELGNYIWGHLGKTPEYRPYRRHSIHNTVFY